MLQYLEIRDRRSDHQGNQSGVVSEEGGSQERVEDTQAGRGSTPERISARSSQLLLLVPAPPIISGSSEISRTWIRAFGGSGGNAS